MAAVGRVALVNQVTLLIMVAAVGALEAPVTEEAAVLPITAAGAAVAEALVPTLPAVFLDLVGMEALELGKAQPEADYNPLVAVVAL